MNSQIITESKKTNLANKLRDAFRRRDRAGVESVESEIRECGLTWYGKYDDDFWFTTLAWFFNPLNSKPSPTIVRCDFSWELFT